MSDQHSPSKHERAKAALLVLALGLTLGVILAIPASYLIEPRRSWTSWAETQGILERQYDPRIERDRLEWRVPPLRQYIPFAPVYTDHE